MIRFLVIGLVLIAGMSSCKKDVLVSESWDMPEQRWITGDQKIMTIIASDTTTAYVMLIKVDHSATYKFQNLYIRLSTLFPSGKKINSVTSLELANPDGTWAGECSGKNCAVLLPLQHGFNFPETGKYQLTIEPFMRMDTIDGLKRISVTCRKRAE